MELTTSCQLHTAMVHQVSLTSWLAYVASLSGGLAVLIDERGIDQLGLLLTAVNKFDEGTFINLLEMTDGDVGF
jgi:hypothetical protein